MTPQLNGRYKPIEGEINGRVVMIDNEHKVVTWESDDKKVTTMIPFHRFIEYWEVSADEAVAP